MKLKFFSAIILGTLFFSCSNGDASGEQRDSANTLQDTFPAAGFKDSIPIDSNPPDATRVDSLNRIPR